MKVISINSVYRFGSTGKIVHSIHQYLKNKGHQSYVLYGRIPKKQEDDVFYFGSKLSFYADVAQSLLFDRHGFNNHYYTKQIIQKLEEIKPDVVHLHNLHGFYLDIKMLMSYLAEKKYIVIHTLHDCFMYTGYCSHYLQYGCEGYKHGCTVCNYKSVYPYRFFAQNHKQHFQLKKELYRKLNNLTIVTPSNWLNNELKMGFLSNYESRVIHNGIPIKDSFVPFERSNYVLSVSNVWNKDKGFDDIIALARFMPEQQFVLIGLSKQQLKNLPANVVGRGRVEYAVLEQYYQEAKLFLNFTYADNFPTVNIEALAKGLWILGYDSGGNAEVFKDCGKVVEKKDFESMKHFIENFNLTSDMQKQAHQLAYTMYQEESMLSQYLNLYMEKIDEKNK